MKLFTAPLKGRYYWDNVDIDITRDGVINSALVLFKFMNGFRPKPVMTSQLRHVCLPPLD